ncbi:tudor domain-containing protein 1 [Pelodytes ibericus]
MQSAQQAADRRVGVRHASLRSPRSFPTIKSPPGAVTPGGIHYTQGNSRENVGNGSSPVTSPTKDMSPILDLENNLIPANILSLGYDQTLFNTIKPVSQAKSCHHCGLHGARRCSQCRQTYYCSVECQKKDWTAHSIICKPQNEAVSKSPSGEGERSRLPQIEFSPDPKNQQEVEKRITLSDLQEREIRKGMESQAFVIEFSSPSNFFLQLYNPKSVESLLKVSSALKEIYTNPGNLKNGYTPALGEVCVAKYTQDKNWYRVLVQNMDVTMKTAHVLYLDYGNQETVTFDNLQQTHKDLELLPPAALKCTLANICAPPCGWTPECLIEVRKLLLGQKLSVTVVQVVQGEIPCYAVDLSMQHTGVHVAKLLLEKRYAFTEEGKSGFQNQDPEMGMRDLLYRKFTFFIDGTQEKPTKNSESQPPTQVLKAINVSVGDVFNAAISDIQNPEEFYCQQLQNARQLADLMETMMKHFSATPADPGFSPSVGEICSAQFTGDDRWYRASVLEHTSRDSVLVGYIDFGNLEVVPLSRLRHILPSMLTFPLQAIKCSLAGVKPSSDKWTKEATSTMMALVANKLVTVKVVAQTALCLVVELLDGSVTPEIVISTQLIESGVAVRKETVTMQSHSVHGSKPNDVGSFTEKQIELPIGKAVDVSVCMLRSPGQFCCQMCNEKDLKSLNEVNVLLRQHCLKNAPSDYLPKEGEVCCAFFSGDGNWYRARVTKVTKTGLMSVCFLDYGDIQEVTADKLCMIPSQLLELPFQAIRCTLAGVTPVGGQWGEESKEKFQMCVVGLKLQAKAICKTEDGYAVELFETESARLISDVLIAEQVAFPDDTKKNVGGVINSPTPKASSSPKAITPESNRSVDRGQAPTTNTSNPDHLNGVKTSSPKGQRSMKNSFTESSAVNKANKQLNGDVCTAREWKSIGLPINEATPACVLSVISPDLFYAYPKESRVDKAKLQQVLMDISQYCKAGTAKRSFVPSIGDMCCARFTADGQWYRAIVVDTAESTAKILYADYGNLETLPISSLHPMKESFLEPPVPIIKCRLADLSPVSEQWSAAAIELLRSLVVGEKIMVTALSVDCGLYSVSVEKLQNTGILRVGEKLISEGLARVSNNSPSKGATCKGECCCSRELRRRVEKLEQILVHLLKQETIQ